MSEEYDHKCECTDPSCPHHPGEEACPDDEVGFVMTEDGGPVKFCYDCFVRNVHTFPDIYHEV